MDWVEVLGLVAMTIVLISFFFSNQIKLRITNIIGAVLYVVYGVLINALSVWLFNALLIAVHAWKLIKIYNKRIKPIKPQTFYNYQNKQIQYKYEKEDNNSEGYDNS